MMKDIIQNISIKHTSKLAPSPRKYFLALTSNSSAIFCKASTQINYKKKGLNYQYYIISISHTPTDKQHWIQLLALSAE